MAMKSKIILFSMALLLQSACSDSGIPEVEAVKERTERVVKVSPDMKEIGERIDGAVQRAAAAGESGDPKAMAKAVGQGTVDVFCAGANNKGTMAKDLGDLASQSAPENEKDMVERARQAVDAAAQQIPDLTIPC